jgi:choline dehydrogenase-like flavoprotein
MIASGQFGDGPLRALDTELDPYTTPDGHPFNWFRVRTLGGKMTLWGRLALRYGPRDFEAGEISDGVAWPFRYEELAPFYEKAEEVLLIGGSVESLADLPDSKYSRTKSIRAPMIPVKDALEARGVRMIPLRQSALDIVDFLRTKLVANPQFALVDGATVRRIELDPRTGGPGGVTYYDEAEKQEKTVRADRVILGASALESTKILLASNGPAHPMGLGNSSGLLGKYLNDHLMVTLHAESKIPFQSNQSGGFIPALDPKNFPNPPGIRGCYEICVFTEDGSTRLRVDIFATATPSAENKITLTGAASNGGSAAKIAVTPSDNDRALLAHAQGMAADLLALKDIEVTRGVPGSAIHEVGTCRMGLDPKSSVLDPYNRLHDVADVLVADGAAFASQSEKNPTLTIMALAARAATKLAGDIERSA